MTNAVDADESEDRPAWHAQIHAVQRDLASEGSRQVVDGDDRLIRIR